MKSIFQVALLLSVACIGLRTSAISAQEKKLSIPSKAAQARVAREMRDVFPSLTKTLRAENNQLLIRELLETASKSESDAAAKYVLSLTAVSQCVKYEDFFTSKKILDQIAEDFDIDLSSQFLGLVKKPRVLSPSGLYELETVIQEVAESEISNDNYEIAANLLDGLLRCIKKNKEPDLAKPISARLKEAKALSKHFKKVQEAQEEVTKSDAPELHQIIGEFYCFRKGQFERGIKHLANGNGPTRDIAIFERQHGKDSQLELADLWWNYSKEAQNDFRPSIVNHAKLLYLKSLNSVEGFRKKQAESRIAEADDFLLGDQGIHRLFVHTWRFEWEQNSIWESTIFRPNGTVRVVSTLSKNVRFFPWAVTGNEIRIEVGSTRHFLIRFTESGELVGAKFDSSSGKKISVGKGLPIEKKE